MAENSAAVAALTVVGDAAGATNAVTNQNEADARASALPYVRCVLSAGEDEAADGPPVWAKLRVSNGSALAIPGFAAAALKSKGASGDLAMSEAPDFIDA